MGCAYVTWGTVKVLLVGVLLLLLHLLAGVRGLPELFLRLRSLVGQLTDSFVALFSSHSHPDYPTSATLNQGAHCCSS